MKAITLMEPGRLVMHDTPAPTSPGPGEALVRVHCVGLCGTDYHALQGTQPFFSYPRILGHELGVEIEAVGPEVAGLRPGDRCAVEPYLNCRNCIACRRGFTTCCVNMRVMGVHVDGGMRERVLVPASNLHPSARLSFEQLALVETLGIGAHAVQRARVEPGELALVIGAGPIGMAVAQFALVAGARVLVMDVSPPRLQFCQSLLPVEAALDARAGAEKALEKLPDLPTVVFDATGNPESMMRAFHLVAHGGRLVFVGLFQGDVTFHDPNFHRREMTLLATRNSTGADFQRIIQLAEAGRVDTASWITHRVACDGLVDAIARWQDPQSGVFKAMVSL